MNIAFTIAGYDGVIWTATLTDAIPSHGHAIDAEGPTAAIAARRVLRKSRRMHRHYQRYHS